jgi:hypothetical protein
MKMGSVGDDERPRKRLASGFCWAGTASMEGAQWTTTLTGSVHWPVMRPMVTETRNHTSVMRGRPPIWGSASGVEGAVFQVLRPGTTRRSMDALAAFEPVVLRAVV